MGNKLFTVAKQMEEVEIALDRARTGVFQKEPNITSIHESTYRAYELLNKVLEELEDLEMHNIDFDSINLDQHFEGNPISDYVTAFADYSLGDVEATKRMMDAASRITKSKVVTSEEGATDLLNRILDTEEEFAEQLEKSLEAIELVLEGTNIDNWTEDQVELARYFLQFQPDASVNEIEELTPHGVQLAWKRRRWAGAAK